MKILSSLLKKCFPTLALLGLAACSLTSPGSQPVAPSPSAAGQMAVTLTATPVVLTDPFAYCATVMNIDAPDERYSGPRMPDAIVKGLMKASGGASESPLDVFAQGSFWRCMDGAVYACFIGANLPCDAKANTSREPTAAETEYCQANPNGDFIPASVTGHDTIYGWSCQDGKPAAGEQVWQVDGRGFIAEIWYRLDTP